MGSIKVTLDGLASCAIQFHMVAITLEDLKSSMDHVFGSVDSKIKRRRNIDGSIADIQKSMKALYTEIENISLFVSSSKDTYEKMETRLEKESNSFIDRMEDIAGLKKEWYQENWFKIAVGTVVTGIAIAVVVVAGPELMFIAVGTVVGGGIYGITEGIESIQNGGEFIDGFSDGFMKGTIETFLAETVGCAGVGVGAKLFAGGTINSFSYTVSTQLNGGTVSAPDLAFEFAKGVGAIAAGEVIFAGIAKYAARGIPKYALNGARAVENPKIIEKEATEVIEGGDESFTWKLRGENVTLNDVTRQNISYVKRNSVELQNLRNEFNTNTRKAFLQDLGKNFYHLKDAGFSETDIVKIQKGRVPDGWQVHHKLPLDDSGTNSFDNLVLIQNEPYHKVITNYQNSVARQLEIGDVQTIPWPKPKGNIYPAQHLEDIKCGMTN